MIRNAKALGVALVAVFALSAMAASSVFANPAAHFKADVAANAPSIIKVEQDGDTTTGLQNFTTDFGSVQCHTLSGEATIDGSASGTASSLTVKSVTYHGHQFAGKTKCEITGLALEAEIKFNGCHYIFYAGTWLGGTPAKATGTADLVCTGGSVVEIVAAGCTITVPAQTGLSHIVYHQVTKTPAEADYVTAEATVTNIKYEGHKLLCATGLKTNGTYTGNAIATAFTDPGLQPVDATIVAKT